MATSVQTNQPFYKTVQELVDEHADDLPTGFVKEIMEKCQNEHKVAGGHVLVRLNILEVRAYPPDSDDEDEPYVTSRVLQRCVKISKNGYLCMKAVIELVGRCNWSADGTFGTWDSSSEHEKFYTDLGLDGVCRGPPIPASFSYSFIKIELVEL